jgi:hypothetical protein
MSRLPMRTSGYLEAVLTPDGLDGAINRTVDALRPLADRFEVVAVRGVSGSLVGPAAAWVLGKHLLVVRKEKKHHSFSEVEGPCGEYRYVIIDDLVATGDTVRSVVVAVAGSSPLSRCVGVYLYNEGNCWAGTAEFFSRPEAPPWLHAEDFDRRVSRLVDEAERKARWRPEWVESHVFAGVPGSRRPLLDLLFPTDEEKDALAGRPEGEKLARLREEARRLAKERGCAD